MKWSWVQVSWLMLLFSGCLVAVSSASTPEAAGPRTITTDVITLESFTWATQETREPYNSLNICWKDDLPSIVGDEVFTLVYTNAEETQLTVLGNGTLLEGSNCVKFSTEDDDVEIPLLPDDSDITYELHIGNGGTTELLGVAVFTLDTLPYEVAGPMIQCGDSYYTRGLVAAAADCKGDNQTFVEVGDICYTTADPTKLVPDEHGCMAAPDATPDGLLVCLSDKALVSKNSGNVTVDSLTYGSEASDNVQILATYTPKETPRPNFELLLQDASSAELLLVSPCDDDVSEACGIVGDLPAVKTYQVCAVGVVDDKNLLFTEPAEITDLDLGVSDTGKKLRFGFNNALEEDRLYYASVAADAARSEPIHDVGIYCNKVNASNTCYGFLDIPTELRADQLLQLTVGYGEIDEQNQATLRSNAIIAPYLTKQSTVSPTEPQ